MLTRIIESSRIKVEAIAADDQVTVKYLTKTDKGEVLLIQSANSDGSSGKVSSVQIFSASKKKYDPAI